jgi:Tfp pilus assembly protein PilO
MSKSNSPQLFFVMAALALAAGTGATIFQYNDLNDKWDELAEIKKDARDPKDIQKELEDTSAKVSASKAELEHLERGVPEFAYVPTMLKELEVYGKQNGIEVLGIRPIPKAEVKSDGKTPRRKKEAYTEIAIEVKGRGPFKAVQSFVGALQKFPKIVSARAVSLQPKEMPGMTGVKLLDATFELRAYLFTPKEGEKMEPASLPGSSEAPSAGTATPATPGKGPAAGTAPVSGPQVSAKKSAAPVVKLKRHSKSSWKKSRNLKRRSRR